MSDNDNSAPVSASSSAEEGAVVSSSQWRERIRAVQTQRMSPEVFQTLRARADRQKEVERARQTASFLERCSHVSRRAQETNLARSSNLRQMQQQQQQQQQQRGAAQPRSKAALWDADSVFQLSPAAAPAPLQSVEVDREYERMAERNTTRSAAMKSILAPSYRSSAAPVAAKCKRSREADKTLAESESDSDGDAAEDDFVMLSAARNEVLDALEQEVAAEERDVATSSTSSSTDFHTLLQSLAEEPSDAAEIVAKFSIYETFLDTVVAIREQTVALWNESRAQFEETARRAGDQEIRRIDCAQTMSVVDYEHGGFPRRWFVYDMMKKAHENHALISRILASIRGKLELLAQQEGLDCPFCLDAITPENALVLGCCHKTCKSCWAHWKELKGARAFCPLCRHQDFVVEILA